MTPEQKQQFEKHIFDECKPQESASDDEVKSLSARNVPTTKPGKCLLACVHEKLEMVCVITSSLTKKCYVFIFLQFYFY